MLADGDEPPLRVGQESPISGRVCWLEAERDDAGASGPSFAQGRKGFWPHQRCVSENHENIGKSLRQSVAGRQNGMGGAATLGLHENPGARRGLFRFGRDIGAIGADDDGDMVGAGLAHGVQHMGEHGASGDLVQGFRLGRAHPLALAGGQHNRQAPLSRAILPRTILALLRRRHAKSLVQACQAFPAAEAGETAKV
jgi:hypothetical protein